MVKKKVKNPIMEDEIEEEVKETDVKEDIKKDTEKIDYEINQLDELKKRLDHLESNLSGEHNKIENQKNKIDAIQRSNLSGIIDNVNNAIMKLVELEEEANKTIATNDKFSKDFNGLLVYEGHHNTAIIAKQHIDNLGFLLHKVKYVVFNSRVELKKIINRVKKFEQINQQEDYLE